MIRYPEYTPVNLIADINIHDALACRNDLSIWQWCRQYTLISRIEQEKWIQKINEDSTIKMFSVRDSLSIQIGVCGFTSIDRQNRSAEFSLYIDPDEQKKGYGIKALATLCKHGFEDWNFNRIWGEVFEGNPAMAMFEKLGFKKEGFLRDTYFRKGKFIGSHIISILDREAAF